MTVRGPISGDRLGVTLMHEHLLIDVSYKWQAPTEVTLRALAEQSFAIELLAQLVGLCLGKLHKEGPFARFRKLPHGQTGVARQQDQALAGANSRADFLGFVFTRRDSRAQAGNDEKRQQRESPMSEAHGMLLRRFHGVKLIVPYSSGEIEGKNRRYPFAARRCWKKLRSRKPIRRTQSRKPQATVKTSLDSFPDPVMVPATTQG